MNARVEQLFDVLRQALEVPGSGRVRMRELIDEDQLRLAPQCSVEVELFERDLPVLDLAPREQLEPHEERARIRGHPCPSTVPTTTSLRWSLDLVTRRLEHRISLADAGR